MYKIVPVKHFYSTRYAIAKRLGFRRWVFILSHEDLVFTLDTAKAAQVYINQVTKL